MFLMLVGGAAGSTAGGIKVNTFGVLVAAVVSTLKEAGSERIRQRISVQHVYRALAVVVLGPSFLGVRDSASIMTEEFSVLNVSFEAVSAFGTVGSPTGITPLTFRGGRFIIIASMFVGRIGPLYRGTGSHAAPAGLWNTIIPSGL